MTATININNLTLCHKASNGISMATIPDVCKTPSPTGPVPIPYPNIAMSSDLMKGTTTVKADGGNMCANYGSEFFKSNGDEPGVAGGVASGTFIKEATWITFSFDVKLEGKAACRLTDKMFHNHQNTVNMAGEIQAALLAFMEKICPIICEVIEKIKKGEKPPAGKSTWTQHINDELVTKYGDDIAKLGVKMEKSALVAAAKGTAKAWGRKAITKFGAKIRNKAVVVIPVVGQIAAAALTVVDVVTTVADVASLAGDVYDVMRVRPDFTITSGGETLAGDIKLPGDSFSPGQKEAFEAVNKGNEVPVLDAESCGCNK